jgi:two-component system NarL family response regulator
MARGRVLIVDDDPLFRESLRAILEDDLEVVGEAADGGEAVSMVTDGGVDLVVMDVSMPRLGGIDATRALVAHDPAVLVVILTGTDDDCENEAIAAGARAYLRKSSGLGGLASLLVGLASVAPPAVGTTDEEPVSYCG